MLGVRAGLGLEYHDDDDDDDDDDEIHLFAS